MELLFNIADIKGLLHHFYQLTNIRIVFFDHEFHELACYPSEHREYCMKIRSSQKGESLCSACDLKACKYCNDTGEPYTYKCHAGLTESVVPVKSNDMVIGYIMFGQMNVEPLEETLLINLVEILGQDGPSYSDLKNDFERSPSITDEYLDSARHIVDICANYLYLSRKVMLKKNTLATSIESYVTEHLAEDLSAQRIAEKFSLSKSALYRLSEQSFGVGIATHVRNIRIHKAKRLLKDTSLPIYTIANQVGINDYNYFTKVFKRETGHLPKDFRKPYILE